MYVEFALREYFIWPTLMEKVRDMFIMTRANIWPKPCPQKISRRHPEDSINLCLSQFLIKQTTLSWKILGPGSLLQVGPIFFGLLCLPCSTKRLNLATWMHWKYALANESPLDLRLDHCQFSCFKIVLRAWEVWRVRTWSSKPTKWRINQFQTPVTKLFSSSSPVTWIEGYASLHLEAVISCDANHMVCISLSSSQVLGLAGGKRFIVRPAWLSTLI